MQCWMTSTADCRACGAGGSRACASIVHRPGHRVLYRLRALPNRHGARNGPLALPYSLEQLDDWLSRGGMARGAPLPICLQGNYIRAAIVYLGAWAPCMFAPSGFLAAISAPA